MKLNVGCDITVRADARCPIVAMLRPRSGLAQWLSSETYVFDPWVPTTEYVDSYGNLCQRMVVPAGDMRIRVEAVVETEDTLAVTPAASQSAVDRLPDDVLQFLLPSRYCPSDTLESRALEVAGAAAAAPGYPQVEAIAPGSSSTSNTGTARATPAPTAVAQCWPTAATPPMSPSSRTTDRSCRRK